MNYIKYDGKQTGGLDFGAELDSLYKIAFNLYDRLSVDFIKYHLVMTRHERRSINVIKNLSFHISLRFDEMIDSREKKGGATRIRKSNRNKQLEMKD